MCSSYPPRRSVLNGRQSAFTLAEVVVSIVVMALLFSGVIYGYVQSGYRAEWAGYNLAAQAQAMQALEQVKAAKWDDSTNQIIPTGTNLSVVTAGTLDIPYAGTNNRVWATNYTTMKLVKISTTDPVYVVMVQVDTKWPFYRNGKLTYYTTSVAGLYGKD